MASQEPGQAILRHALQWALPILRRAANLTQDGPIPTPEPEKLADTPSTKSKNLAPVIPTEAIAVLEAAKEAATLQEAGVEMPCKPPEAKRIRIALEWALLILKTEPDRRTPTWIPALAALTRRELRFWREAGEVSGNVTRRAASRAIRGLEQILKTIPADQRDS